MTMPGLGVMIRMLSGNEDSVDALTASLGKTISALKLGEDDALHFTFDDGTKMKLSDEGQSCCESRYMRTDDDLSSFVGATFESAETRNGPGIKNEDLDVHEIQFLVVKTSKGSFTMSSHNEHNGYYGGFSIEASLEA